MRNRIALTVDVEPDWGVKGARAFREVTPRFLRFLEERDMRATFFVVSNLVDESSEPVAAMREGNEVASHGCSHRLLDTLDEAEADRELKESRERLAEVAGSVEGFRAPFFRRCGSFFARVRRAGYRYDASLGSVLPGPGNGRLHSLLCPFARDSTYEFPTSAMGAGMLPLSLTWLRLLAPAGRSLLPPSASLIYLHLHEFLPAETASCLPLPLRRVLTRNCGEAAWRILEEALERLDAQFITCREMLGTFCSDRGETAQEKRPDG